ncbi:MAG TPA: class I SAM-dependent rRNA methyltransferase [Planctomycetota bacterium]|nr:class I SAM-dependent rRNA methyltransferase [Planctomycetota bacterium]
MSLNDLPAASDGDPGHRPGPAQARTTVVLRSASERQSHPWIFRRTVKQVSGEPRDGDEVLVTSSAGFPIGRGFWHGRSNIAVRLISHDPDLALDEHFLRERLARAVALRRDLLGLERRTDAYRVVHSEGDGLSGLVVDRYASLVVLEFYSAGFFRRRELLRELFIELFGDVRVVFKVASVASDREGLPADIDEDSGSLGDVETEITENKMRFLVRPTGHKTGFFLDQRENRERWAGLVRGAKVLDAFAYTGGFAIAARTLGRAREVVAVDLDEEAVEQGRRNARLNRADIDWRHEDAFRFLRNHRHAVERFDAISVDPPKWATDRRDLETAGRRYIDVNTYAIEALRPGGLLVSSSCSGLISPEAFLGFLRRAAERAGRELQLVHFGGAAGDHPVAIHCPETRYLKVAFARVL